MKQDLDKMRYEYALHRIEELLPLVGEDTPASDPSAIELAIMSDAVIAYEKVHYPIGKPTTAQLIQLSLEEKGISQKQLAQEIGVSPSRINDYVTGRAEPTLRVARRLCATLGIAPALLLGM
ncbi:MAG: helix-turn-helix transcriptional regulator [Bacteroidales bacterium]|nr:helix-turn-helix transcriptional regulator [Bacteroidales bacterium]